jgi:hypothetical protein
MAIVARLFAIVLMCWWCGSCMSSCATAIRNSKPGGAADADFRIDAVRAAQESVRRVLKDPASARFPSVFGGVDTRAHATKNGSGGYDVRSYVDAKNSFGGQKRVWYTATVTGSNPNWDVSGVQLEE